MVLPKLLVIDNYDSFTYNLVKMFMRYDLMIEVHRSDMISLNGISALKPDYVLISPGPKDPAHAGIGGIKCHAMIPENSHDIFEHLTSQILLHSTHEPLSLPYPSLLQVLMHFKGLTFGKAVMNPIDLISMED